MMGSYSYSPSFQIWKRFDADCSGYIEANELKNFIKELLKAADKTSIVSEDDLIQYADTMVSFHGTLYCMNCL